MAVIDTLYSIAPEFADTTLYPVERVNAIIDIVNRQVAIGLCGGGEKRDDLLAYLAAHTLSIGSRSFGATGEIASVSEGQLAITYNNKGKESTGGLSTTVWGQRYQALVRGCSIVPRTRVKSVYVSSSY